MAEVNNLNSWKTVEIIFDTLRATEGIEKGKLSTILGIEVVCWVLTNRRYKEEKGITPTDFEEAIANESGSLVRMYMAERYQQPKFQALQSVPFPQYDLTLQQALEKIKQASQTADEYISTCSGLSSEEKSDMCETTEGGCKTLKPNKDIKQ